MGSSVQRLTKLADSEDRFAVPYADLREAHIEGMNERFQERKDRIKLLGHRAKEGNISEIRSREDMVPLLFPHTAYKSYRESFLTEGRWDRLNKWLNTISSYPIAEIETSDIQDIDEWIARLEAKGHYISASSGTTGKSAMLIASEQDMAWTRKDTIGVFSWGSGVKPERDRRMFGTGAIAHVAKNRITSEAQVEAFGDPRFEPFRFPVPPITVGQLTNMVLLRKAMSEGTARPDEIAEFETTSQERQKTLDEAVVTAAEALVAARGDKLMIGGQWNGLYQLAKLVRDLGYSGKDFHPDNCIYVGGGLKRAQLPPDYQEFVRETFNIPANRNFQNYSMQELNSGMPQCQEGERYHVPPWVVPFVLNEAGDEVLPDTGEAEGRAAFVDLALDGRWNGVISGDKVSVDFNACACGNASPSVRNDIVRYADLKGDDKIGCAGTVDAYVRGLS